jgi:hypothetical protein
VAAEPSIAEALASVQAVAQRAPIPSEVASEPPGPQADPIVSDVATTTEPIVAAGDGSAPSLAVVDDGAEPLMQEAANVSGEAAMSAQPAAVDVRPQPAWVGMTAHPVGAGVALEPDRAGMRAHRSTVAHPDRAEMRPHASGAGTQPLTDGVVQSRAVDAHGDAALANTAGLVGGQDAATSSAESTLDLAIASQDPLFATILIFAQQTAQANGDPTSSDPETAGVQTAAISTDRASIHVLVLPALEQVVTAIVGFIPSTGGPAAAALLTGLGTLGGVGVWLRRVGRRRS